MKRLFLIIGLAVITLNGFSQVGIGTKDPNPSAELHIKSADKGLLIPRTLLDNISDAAAALPNGLLIYNTAENMFYFNDSLNPADVGNSNWQCVNPFETNSTDGSISPKDPYNHINGTFFGPGATPIGGIIMWYGAFTNFDTSGLGTGDMEGWALCNGNNGTPDLRGRFIVGYSDNTDTETNDTNYPENYGHRNNSEASVTEYTSVGNHGGIRSTILSILNLPSHTHTVNDPGHSHTDNFSIASAGSHHHTVDGAGGGGSTRGYDWTRGTGDDHDSHDAGAHTHTLNGGVQSNTTGITVGNTGSGNSFSNQPPYYVLGYIMRIN